MQLTPQHQLTLPMNNPPPKPLLPAQPTPNPNNKAGQPVMAAGLPNYPSYSSSTVDCHDIHLHSGRKINKTTSPIIIEEEDKETPEILPA